MNNLHSKTIQWETRNKSCSIIHIYIQVEVKLEPRHTQQKCSTIIECGVQTSHNYGGAVTQVSGTILATDS